MSTFTVESKSQLAKLMATENITVQHQKIHTAKFDVKNRVLYLPIWKDMGGYLYDLLTGHEVGHALYTPVEGWHDAVINNNKGRGYKNFLNVVEDARIEKKVQRRYPGLRSSFIKAYKDLFARDFFGVGSRDVNTMAFVDRLNMFTKSQYTLDVRFNETEQTFVDRIKLIETWDDVVSLTDDIYEYSKEEQYQQELNDFDFEDMDSFGGDGDGDEFDGDMEFDESFDSEESGSSDGDGDGDEFDGDMEFDESFDGEESGSSDGDDSDDKSGGSSGESQSGDSDDESTDTNSFKFNRFKDENVYKGNFDPICETDEAYRKNEVNLLDEKCKEYVYLDIPKPILSKIITPAKRVQQQLTSFYEEMYSPEKIKSAVDAFKTKNERYVSLLAKEFEMRKAAKAFAKSKLSDTGDIDINKLSSYKFDDNIFRKIMLVPKGKSHGLVMLLDGSGSMRDNMAGSIEQILVIAMFCRKVNIPFVVYSFNDNEDVMRGDLDLDYDGWSNYIRSTGQNYFTKNYMELNLGTVRLREYLNSNMNNMEFNKALSNMVCLKKSYESPSSSKSGEWQRPDSEDLSNTPLNSAIVAMATIIKQFKRVNNLDITSLVIIHDGDSDNIKGYISDAETRYAKHFSYKSQNVVFQDKLNKYQLHVKFVDHFSDNQLTTEALLDWFTKVTDSKVIGFFIVVPSHHYIQSALYNRYVFEDNATFESKRWTDYGGHTHSQELNQIKSGLASKLKAENYLMSHNKGYHQFFFVNGGKEMVSAGDEIEVEGKVTAGKLKTAFMKMSKKRQVSRVMVSKFIESIAI